jgi:hypothetical protein
VIDGVFFFIIIIIIIIIIMIIIIINETGVVFVCDGILVNSVTPAIGFDTRVHKCDPPVG